MLFPALLITAIIFDVCNADLPPILRNDPLLNGHDAQKVPPCKSCTALVESFKKGLERTARNKHDGGDADWEEKKLGSYKTSEVRLVEIQESLCRDVSRGVDQCHSLASENDHLLEEWWFKHQNEYPDLFPWLCIDNLKVCCPHNSYGPNCDPCPDCNGNGKCKGNGTRKGNGKCACDAGYSGEFCSECDTEYYEAFRDGNIILCSPCHIACGDDGCTGGGSKKCRSCKVGWSRDENGGCNDINECISLKQPCTINQFCVNNEGSFTCLECDRSCVGCSGDGPDLCDKCAKGYELRDGQCRDISQEKRDKYVTYTRYLVYLGLCFAIAVIFQSSTWIGAVVGVVVALYISVSEYWLSSSPSSATPIVDTKKLEEMIRDSL